MQRIGGIRRRSRYKMTKPYKMRGKIQLRKYFQVFKDGDKVVVKAEPAIQKGLYHQRFHGKIGSIVGKTGRSYKVEINDLGKRKILMLHPVHLRRL
jgi:large subunit ribosomal protein L21e